MDRNRTVAGLDVHKDSIYLCIMGHDEAIIFEKNLRSADPGSASDVSGHGGSRSLGGSDGKHGGLLGTRMERALRVDGTQAGDPVLHQVASRTQERCQGRAVDSGVSAEESHPGKFRAGTCSPGHAQAQSPHHGPQRRHDLQLQQA